MKNWVKLPLVLCRGNCFINELFAILGSVRGRNPSKISTELESHVVSTPSLAWNDCVLAQFHALCLRRWRRGKFKFEEAFYKNVFIFEIKYNNYF